MSFLSVPDIKPQITNPMWFATRNLSDIQNEVSELENGLFNWVIFKSN